MQAVCFSTQRRNSSLSGVHRCSVAFPWACSKPAMFVSQVAAQGSDLLRSINTVLKIVLSGATPATEQFGLTHTCFSLLLAQVEALILSSRYMVLLFPTGIPEQKQGFTFKCGSESLRSLAF